MKPKQNKPPLNHGEAAGVAVGSLALALGRDVWLAVLVRPRPGNYPDERIAAAVTLTRPPDDVAGDPTGFEVLVSAPNLGRLVSSVQGFLVGLGLAQDRAARLAAIQAPPPSASAPAARESLDWGARHAAAIANGPPPPVAIAHPPAPPTPRPPLSPSPGLPFVAPPPPAPPAPRNPDPFGVDDLDPGTAGEEGEAAHAPGFGEGDDGIPF